MSAPHFSWALRMRNLKPAQRLVLCAIAERANGDLACWPSIAVIANDVELTERAVYRAIDFLVNERKLIRKVIGEEREQLLAKAGCKGDVRANVYQLKRTIVPDEDEHSSINGFDPEHSSPSTLNTVHPEHSSPLNTVQFDPDSESPEPTIESTRERTVLRTAVAAEPPRREPEQKVLEIFGQDVVDRVAAVTQRSKAGSRELIGQWRKLTRHDDKRILEAIEVAERMGTRAGVGVIRKHLERQDGIAGVEARLMARLDAREAAEAAGSG